MDRDIDHGYEARNDTWLPKMVSGHLNLSSGVLIAVKAGHFFGLYNLISLLTQRGFTIRQIDEQRCYNQFLPDVHPDY